MKFYYWTRSESESLGIGDNGPYRLLHRERYYRKLEWFKNKNRRVQEMEKKIREEILGDKADEIREEIWQKERYAERESLKLAKNEKVKEKLIELFTDIQVAREEITIKEDLQKVYRENISNMDIENVIRESIVVIDIFTEEEKAIKERLDKLN